FATVADGRSTARAEPEPNELVVPIGVGAAGLSFIALSIFSLLAASFSGSAGGSGFKVGLSELYGSMSANNVGLLRMIGVTSLRSTARAACGKSLAGRSRTRRARGSPCTLHWWVGICAAVAISM